MNRRTLIKRSGFALSATFTPSLIVSLLSSCEKKSSEQLPELKWLSPEEYKTIHEIVNIILPTTSTPGAIDAGVMNIFDMIVADCISESDKIKFREGLTNIVKIENQAFHEQDRNHQTNVVKELDAGSFSGKVSNEAYQTIKTIALQIYFTSEKGINANFDYRPVPGRYEGCVPFKEGEKVWLSSLV